MNTQQQQNSGGNNNATQPKQVLFGQALPGLTGVVQPGQNQLGGGSMNQSYFQSRMPMGGGGQPQPPAANSQVGQNASQYFPQYNANFKMMGHQSSIGNQFDNQPMQLLSHGSNLGQNMQRLQQPQSASTDSQNAPFQGLGGPLINGHSGHIHSSQSANGVGQPQDRSNNDNGFGGQNQMMFNMQMGNAPFNQKLEWAQSFNSPVSAQMSTAESSSMAEKTGSGVTQMFVPVNNQTISSKAVAPTNAPEETQSIQFSNLRSDKGKFDVLDLYEQKAFPVSRNSLFYGELDTGIDIGRFFIDTSDFTRGQDNRQHQYNLRMDAQYANIFMNDVYNSIERYQSPFCRTQLNTRELAESFKVADESEIQPNHQMEEYFKLINSQMHGKIGQKIESEQFYHEFRLPKCYDMPKLRGISSVNGNFILPQRCKQFPDRVLFYIFYSTPHDKAQVNVANELRSRSWIYCSNTLRWIKKPSKSDHQMMASTKKPGKTSARNNSKGVRGINSDKDDNAASIRTLVIFNPLLWKEEIVNVEQD